MPEARPGLLKRLLSAVAPAPPAVSPYKEAGVAGTAVFGGYVQNLEKSSKWVGAQRYITIADMAVNASIVAAGVHYFLNLLAHPRWSFEPADESAEAKRAAELVEECLNDMAQSWSRVVRRAGTYRFYGFGVQEWTAKKRLDGSIGLASIEPRMQATIERWAVTESGEVEGVWQRSPQTGTEHGIPRSKFLYLVDDVLTDSPEGVGIFRHLAEPWERLKSYYELEARGFERDLRGTPVGRVPYTLIREAVRDGVLTKGDAENLTRVMEDFVKLQVKKSDTSITLDSIPYYSQAADGSKVASVPQWGLELLQGGAASVAEVSAAITRTQTEMARILSCEHLMMGESSGNRSLAEDKSRNLYLIANAVLGDVVAGVKRDIIPVICSLNGVPEGLYPEPEVEDVAFKDAASVAEVLAKMAQAGATLAPDDPVVEDVRSLMGVSLPPEPDPEMMGLPTVPPPEPPNGGPAGPEGGQGLPEDEPPPEGGDGTQKFEKEQERTLYVHRKLLNANAVRAWAREQGFETLVVPEQMHVTVAFSREPVDWGRLTPDGDAMVVASAPTEVETLAPRGNPKGGAAVLRFESPELTARRQEIKDAGASYDFPEYRPYVILTYGLIPDLAAVEPYRGPLIFGPEAFEEVIEDWDQTVAED